VKARGHNALLTRSGERWSYVSVRAGQVHQSSLDYQTARHLTTDRLAEAVTPVEEGAARGEIEYLATFVSS
jgi:hypothetical protein